MFCDLQGICACLLACSLWKISHSILYMFCVCHCYISTHCQTERFIIVMFLISSISSFTWHHCFYWSVTNQFHFSCSMLHRLLWCTTKYITYRPEPCSKFAWVTVRRDLGLGKHDARASFRQKMCSSFGDVCWKSDSRPFWYHCSIKPEKLWISRCQLQAGQGSGSMQSGTVWGQRAVSSGLWTVSDLSG